VCNTQIADYDAVARWSRSGGDSMHGQQTMGWAPGGAREDRRTGTVHRLIHNPDTEGPAFRVLEVRIDGASEVWTGEVAQVEHGASVVGYGHDQFNNRFSRREFKCRAIVVAIPTDNSALEKFLVQAKLPGIGKKKAKEVVRHFGSGMIDVLAKAPHRLGEIKGLGGKNLPKLVETVQNRALDLLLAAEMASYGAQGAVAKRILAKYGAQSLEVVRTDPYGLSFEVAGVGFKTADAIAAAQGISGDNPRRVQAAIMAVLDKASDDGHIYLPTREAIWRAAELLGEQGVYYQFAEAITALAEQRHVARQNQGQMLGIRRLVLAEQKVAERLSKLAGDVRVVKALHIGLGITSRTNLSALKVKIATTSASLREVDTDLKRGSSRDHFERHSHRVLVLQERHSTELLSRHVGSRGSRSDPRSQLLEFFSLLIVPLRRVDHTRHRSSQHALSGLQVTLRARNFSLSTICSQSCLASLQLRDLNLQQQSAI
jgi:hypothetical protein